MKKYYPIDFDTKGNAILGEARNTPTSNSFIPTTWAPGGGSEDEGNGIMSIAISPSITTTPALDSLFPIYYEDLTEEQIQDGVQISSTVESGVLKSGDAYQFTITPTEDWYVYDTDSHTFGNKGEPYTITVTAEDDNLGITLVCASDNVNADNTKTVAVIITVSAAQ